MLFERDVLLILVMTGRRTDEHVIRREVGIGSKSQLVSRESDRSLKIPSMVTLLKEEIFGGVVGGRM
jgi:hypothetical protein